MQEVVSIREANQHFSCYQERFVKGAEIIITHRISP